MTFKRLAAAALLGLALTSCSTQATETPVSDSQSVSASPTSSHTQTATKAATEASEPVLSYPVEPVTPTTEAPPVDIPVVRSVAPADPVTQEPVVVESALPPPEATVESVGPVPIPAPEPTAPASGLNWDALAECESGGNWSTATGNGYHGGLQFSQETWYAMGGTGSAASASRTEQIQRASELAAVADPATQWPQCHPNLYK